MTNQLDLFSALGSEAASVQTSVTQHESADVSPGPVKCRSGSLPDAPRNFADALAGYQDAASDHPRRVQFRTALRRVAKVLRLPLEQVPATPDQLRPLLAKANPAGAGIKPANWKTLKSGALAALRDAGVDVVPSRSSAPLSPEWGDLLERLDDRALKIGLSRLVHHFSEAEVFPAQVTIESFETYRALLTERSLLKDAEGAYRQSVRHWNKAAANVAGWPTARAPTSGDPRRFSFEWHDFPRPFVEDVESFLAAKSDTDPLSDDYAKPTRKTTTDGRRKTFRVLGSALLLSCEIAVEDLVSLEVLTRPDNVRAALRYLRDVRSGGKTTESHINHAWLARTTARYWLKDEARSEEIKTLIGNLTAHVRKGAGKGMTAKNRERLLPFTIPSNVDALVGLPEKVHRATKAIVEPTNSDAVRVMRALQVGILTFVPIRSRNLVQLELGAHLIDVGKGSKRTVRIHLPGEITKTYRDYSAPLPRHLFPLLDSWINVHRGKISPKASPFLFPNPSGELRSRDSMTAKLQKFLRSETGLIVNAHLFRHIAAKLYLDYDPAGIEIVRQLLGHKSIKTTLAVYAELQTDPAFRRMEEALLNVGYALAREDIRAGKGPR